MTRHGQVTHMTIPKRRNAEGMPLCRICGIVVQYPRRSFCSDKCSWIYYRVTHWGTIVSTVRRRFGRQPRCAVCGPGRVREHLRERHVSWEVDHIVELADGGDWWAAWNLQLLCAPCHAEKSAASRRARRQVAA
jgi:5-methylcytosine-specific restriction endonuclease McrA